jgi:acyl carrier protein
VSGKSPLTHTEALAMLAECFSTDPSLLSKGTARDAIPGWDSMGALMLMAELDERFGIELSAEASREMQQVGDVLAFLHARGALQEAP